MSASHAESQARSLLERQATVESNARTYPRRLPIAIARAAGAWVTDVDGRRYIDCLSCAGALPLGHNAPSVVEALQRHLRDGLPMQTLDLQTPTKHEYVEALLGSFPESMGRRAKVHFCGPSGSDAVEAALKLAKIATGRRTVLAFQGGYHGQTHGSLALMGNLGPKTPITGTMADVQFLPFPYAYRCPFHAPGRDTACGCRTENDACSSTFQIESMLDDVESGVTQPAAMILEVVQGEGGCIAAPLDWLREIRRITRERQIPLIVDEVQTGWGRTGTLYAFERAGIEPDIVVLSKAIGGGLPLAAIVYDEALDVWRPGAHTGTFRGNLMAMTAGLATLRQIQTQRLAEHAERMGERLMDRLRSLAAELPWIGDVRGRGLMIGAEIVDPQRPDRLGRPSADGRRARAIQQACFERGLLIELGGRGGCVLRFLPPLIVTPAEVDAIAGIVAAACLETRGGSDVSESSESNHA
ncbi:MAG: diaminobutyrate--2-oxoglutarate transaminase family protein [Pirellulales bacterium]